MEFYTTDISIFETADGILSGDKRSGKRFDSFISFLDRIRILSPIGQYSLEAARIKASTYRKGRPIDDNDCFIAALMKKSGINTIVTRNVRHFTGIPGIKPISY